MLFFYQSVVFVQSLALAPSKAIEDSSSSIMSVNEILLLVVT